ncbi:uncharacterized protein HD556DRAFT_1448296 [Suillus plorans]|uniref:DUF6532 domain-containing protein n=1 Tax=Suillus plorans TaxID=116603 RepID=A0A9P7AEZ0_9AGAM|nr:uncharacterized protein HD556DRAFT_1448296 [Suillus plorans]KAG1787967.1 hypothetical protein HD556DRAFT_1448296 [Suillus plorans]
MSRKSSKSSKPKEKAARSLTSTPPVAKTRGQKKAPGSKVQVSDNQYEEFLKFQAQKKKEAELNRKENVRKKVDALLDEERLQTTSVVPDGSDIDHIDGANPADILPAVVPPKKKVSLDFSDEDAENEADSDGNDEGGDVGKEDESLESTGVRRRTNGLIQVKDEPKEDNAERKCRRRISKGDRKPPTTLASLKKDGCGPLVDLAHQLLHVKIALETAFPGPSVDVQDSFVWDCIKEAVKNPGSPLKSMFDAISQDEALKNRAMAYVWSGASQLRGELVRKARENVAFLLQQMKPKDIGEVATWLISTKKDPFLCGELDLKTKTFNKNFPFRAVLLRQLLISQFFQGAGSEGLLYKDLFQKLPDNLLALLATAAECAFKGMLSGSPVVIEFKEPVFQPRHQYYMLKLAEYRKHSPMYMEKLRQDLWAEIGEACGFVMRNEVDDSGSELDFEAMEEYGRLQTNTIVSDVTVA